MPIAQRLVVQALLFGNGAGACIGQGLLGGTVQYQVAGLGLGRLLSLQLQPRAAIAQRPAQCQGQPGPHAERHQQQTQAAHANCPPAVW